MKNKRLRDICQGIESLRWIRFITETDIITYKGMNRTDTYK